MDEIEALQAAARQCLSRLCKTANAEEREALLKRMAECWEQADELQRRSTTAAR